MVFENLTIGMAALWVGLILLAFAQFVTKSAKTRKMNTNLGIFLLIVGLIPLILPGTVPFLEGGLGLGTLTTSVPSGTPTGLAGCSVEDTTVTLSAVNQFTAAASSGTHRYRINGAPGLTVSDAGTFTASPGDQIDILWENEAAASTYFGENDVVTLGCVGTQTISKELVQNGTLTIEVFNEEGNLIDGNAENETLAAGDVVTLTAKLKGQFERGFPHGGVIVAEWNNDTSYDDVIVNFGGAETNVPSVYSVSATTNKAKAYTVPPILSNQIVDGSVTLDADDTNNPASDNDVTLTFYANDYYIDENNGGAHTGPSAEDEDDVLSFGHTTAFTVSVD